MAGKGRLLSGLCMAGLVCSWPAALRAAVRTWTGDGITANWTDALNWMLLRGPAAGDDLTFPSGATRLTTSDNFAAGTVFNELTFGSAGYTVRGNAVGLSGGIVVSHGSGSTIISAPITLASNQTFQVTQSGADLFLNGPLDLKGQTLTLDGAGLVIAQNSISTRLALPVRTGLIKQGAGTFWLLSDASYFTPTVVNGGTLLLGGSLSNSVVTVNSGGALNGSGALKGLNVNSGGTVRPSGLVGPGILDVTSDVMINPGGTYVVRLNGTTAGSDYEQLRTGGSITLGGTLDVSAGYTPAVGDAFTIIQNLGTNAVSGTFAGLPQGTVFTLNGRPLRITYGFGGIRFLDSVVLQAIPALSVWDGGGGLNHFWSQPLNWMGDVLPMPGDDIEFTNGGSATLSTVNDFPAGRTFGSMIFAGGSHQAQGSNLATFNGNIQVTEAATAAVALPIDLAEGIHIGESGRLTLGGPLALAASQTFLTETNALLMVSNTISGADHELTIDGAGTTRLAGALSGSAEFVKNGEGLLYLFAEDDLPTNIINAGTFDLEGRVYGKVLVNPGGRLTGGFFSGSGLSDVEVHGGTLDPSFGTEVYGTLRLLEGANFNWSIIDQGANGVFSTYVYMWNPTNLVELNNCNLDVSIQPGTRITRGDGYLLIHAGAISGTFNGLPEGSRFINNGHVFTISYANGVFVTADLPFVWSGGGAGGNWTTAANWVGGMAPVGGADLTFPGGVSKVVATNDYPAGAEFRSLYFLANSYVLRGNPLVLTGGITNDAPSGETVVSLDMAVSPSNFEIAVGNSSILRLQGAITRGAPFSPQWFKTGSGILRLEGNTANTQSQVEVKEGELDLAKTAGVNAVSGSLIVGDGTSAAAVVLLGDEQVVDTAGVTVNSLARLDLNGHTESIEALNGGGSIELGGILSLGGQLNILSQGYFSGDISGWGGLTKSGSGYLTLSGTNNYTGTTVLTDGYLDIEGMQTNSQVRLDGGVLLGRGWAGVLVGNSGGIVRPGSGSAAFQVALHSRDVSFNPSITFEPTLTSTSPGYENFKLQVTGTVSLGGCALRLMRNPNNFVPPVGSTFVTIDNDGTDPVVGTFGDLPEGAVFGGAGTTFRISYHGGDGNDVMLTRVAAPPSSFGSVNLLTNGNLSITGLGTANVQYTVEVATNLVSPVSWVPVGIVTADTNGLFQYVESGTAQVPMRFYRAVSP